QIQTMQFPCPSLTAWRLHCGDRAQIGGRSWVPVLQRHEKPDRLSFNCHRDSLSAADAQRGNSSPFPAIAQCVDEGRENAGAARSDRMAQRDRPPADIDARWVQAKLTHDGKRLS